MLFPDFFPLKLSFVASYALLFTRTERLSAISIGGKYNFKNY